MLPVDEAGKVILPYDKDGKPLIHVAADNVTPLETEQALALVSVLIFVRLLAQFVYSINNGHSTNNKPIMHIATNTGKHNRRRTPRGLA